MAQSSPNPFRSARLSYRAICPDSEVDQALFVTIQEDSFGNRMSSCLAAAPPSKDDADELLKAAADKEKNLLSVIICIPKDEDENDITTEPNHDPEATTPIGSLFLMRGESGDAALGLDRFATEIGIDLAPEYQGKGYGTEAIQWALKWAFHTLGMHKVAITAFEYNERAVKLYERLGFKLEGRLREQFFFEGRFWDDMKFGMLISEWKELAGNGATEITRR